MSKWVRIAATWFAFAAFSATLADEPETRFVVAAPAATSQPERDPNAAYKSSTPAGKAAVLDLTLHDAVRDKDLPIKVRYPLGRQGAAPVVVFSHGAGGSGDAFAELTDGWARRGYVVILPTHSDSIRLRRQQGEDVRDVREELKTIVSKVRPLDRLADVKLILDSLDTIEAKLPQLKASGGKLDRERIGMAGHSAGALTTQMAVGVKVRTRLMAPPAGVGDTRIKAAIVISGQGTTSRMFTKDSWSELARPMMVFSGSLDTTPLANETPESRTEPFELAKGPDKYLVYIEGATHGSYAGKTTTVLLNEKPTTDIKLITDVVGSSTLAFWDAHLRGDAQARAYLASEKLVRLGADKTTYKRK